MIIHYRQPFWPDGLYQDGDGYYRFDGDRKIDADTFVEAWSAIGRNDAPALLFDLTLGGHLDIEKYPGVVADAWSAAEYPERVGDRGCMPAYLWVQLFTKAGYTHDGQHVDRPTEPVPVYRGAIPKCRFGMAWTSDLAVAQRFATGRLRGRAVGHVYVFQAPPAALLAFIGREVGRDENEYVINPDYLSKATVKPFNQKGPK